MATYPTPTPVQPTQIGAIPTPFPPENVNFTPQTSGGAMYSAGFQPTPYTSYQGVSYGSNGQIVSTAQNPAVRNVVPAPERVAAPAPTPASQPAPMSTGPGDLVSALVGKGYSYQDALNAANGPDAARLRAEYLGGGSNQGGAGGDRSTYKIGGSPVSSTNITDTLKSMGYGLTDFPKYAEQYGNDFDKYKQSIEAQYAPQFEELGRQESALEAARKNYEGIIQSDYAANLSKASAAKQSTSGKLAESRVEAERRKQDALNTARRLYNELQSGYRQRFGGASSAGEAAQAILGAEQQRQAGSIQQDYGSAVRQIQAQAVDLENSYNSQIQELETNKQRAIAEVQTNFQSGLAQINSNKTQAEFAKQQAIRDLLTQTRNEMYAINQNNQQMAMQVAQMTDAQRQNLAKSLEAMQKAQGGFTSNALAAVNAIPTQVTSNIGQNNRQVTSNVLPTTAPIQSAVGMIGAPRSYQGQELWPQY